MFCFVFLIVIQPSQSSVECGRSCYLHRPPDKWNSLELCNVGGSEPWHTNGKGFHVGYTAGINKTCDKLYATHGGMAVNSVFLRFIKAYSKLSE